MLLQTNSYVVPKDKRAEHARLLRKFRATLHRLGCDHFEVYEQVGANWAGGETTGRFVQLMRFRDRQHQQEIQLGEKNDPEAQRLIQEFCALINFPYQQQQGLFAVGFYNSAISVAGPGNTRSPQRPPAGAPPPEPGSVQEQSGGPPTGAAGGIAGAALAGAAEADRQAEGSALSDFANITAESPAVERPPMRLATDTDDDDVVAEVDPGQPAPAAEHSGAFADGPEAMLDLVNSDEGTHDLLTDSDREAVLGELTGDDVTDPEPDNDDDRQARSHAR
jgi:hypothetical protein